MLFALMPIKSKSIARQRAPYVSILVRDWTRIAD